MNKAQPQPRHWRKSSFSGQTAPECVEVAQLDDSVGTRDSKNRSRGHLAISPVAWAALMQSIKQ
ncbi:DUF397 domain-containing protein [Embleya sp. NPDC050154]|uniref:DUF397 domain-containing protein n=1 Tax=Embleya sp. NPDC050154 TaxID=3363988 RepID=UPI0037B0FC9A